MEITLYEEGVFPALDLEEIAGYLLRWVGTGRVGRRGSISPATLSAGEVSDLVRR